MGGGINTLRTPDPLNIRQCITNHIGSVPNVISMMKIWNGPGVYKKHNNPVRKDTVGAFYDRLDDSMGN